MTVVDEAELNEARRGRPAALAVSYVGTMAIVPLRLGPKGIAKKIFLGAREAEVDIDYLRAFIALARRSASL